MTEPARGTSRRLQTSTAVMEISNRDVPHENGQAVFSQAVHFPPDTLCSEFAAKTCQSSRPEKEEMQHQYHQQAHLVAIGDYTWQIPSASSVHQVRGSSDTDQGKMGKKLDIAGHFHKMCFKIAKNWSCAPSECVPAALRHSTPYSLAVLDRLGKLSNTTSGDMQRVHALLMAIWSERHTGEIKSASASVVSKVASFSGQKKNLEQTIVENVNGLMLVDLECAKHRLSEIPTSSSDARFNKSQKNKADPICKRRTIQAKGRGRRHAFGKPSGTLRIRKDVAVSAAGRDQTHSNSFDTLPDLATLTMSNKHEATGTTSDIKPALPFNARHSKAQHNTLRKLGNALEFCTMDDNNERRETHRERRARKQHLKLRGRRNRAARQLPSEQYQLGPFPPLLGQFGQTNVDYAGIVGGSMAIDGQTPSSHAEQFERESSEEEG